MMPGLGIPARLVTRFNEWPERDRAAWLLDCSPSHPYDDDGPHFAVTLRPSTLGKMKKGYGRWLRFLEARGWLDPDLPALERVTRLRLGAYLRELKRAGNANSTIVGRVQELEMTLKALSPGQDVSWLQRPWGPTLYSSLPQVKRALLVPDANVLFEWGLALMDGAEAEPVPNLRLTRYRDGLLIAMLAARARRIRSVHLLRIDRELTKSGGRYRIELSRDQTKTKADRFWLPDRLTLYLDYYLEVVRPALATSSASEAMWISHHGTPLTEKGLTTQIFRRTLKRFGTGFGPHRFRHALATSTTYALPGHPDLAAAVLGISGPVAAEHYVRADQVRASQTYAALVKHRAAKYRASERARSAPKSESRLQQIGSMPLSDVT